MKSIQEVFVNKESRDVKVIQFGEGNFLRAFTDWMIQKMNDETDFNGNVVIVQPLATGLCQVLEEQNCLYTHFMNGIKNGEAVSEHMVNNSIEYTVNPYDDYMKYLSLADIETVKFIISNTTEAGISYVAEDTLNNQPQKSYPGKLTALLYRRYKTFKGDANYGLTVLPCELIEQNGDKLKEIILRYAKEWDLEKGFTQWIEEANTFCNTLVDRIVPGYPRDRIEEVTKELGYIDKLVVESEQFNLWVIEGPESIKEIFPIDQTDCNVLFVEDMTPYRTRKVRILNGAHTMMVPIGYLYGIKTVRETVEDDVMGQLVQNAMHKEIIPTLSLSKEALEVFASEVVDRFKNPFIKHYLLSISLNSMSKYKTRVLPSVLGYLEKKGQLPKILVLTLAAYIVFYKGEEKNGTTIPLNDGQDILDLYKKLWSDYDDTEEGVKHIVKEVLAYEALWKGNLNDIPGLHELVSRYVSDIMNNGMQKVVKEVI